MTVRIALGHRPLLATAALALAVPALAACSASVSVGTGSESPRPSTTGDTIDEARAAAAITEQISSQVGADIDVTISCPPDQALKAGGTFDCTGTVDGQPITVAVTQKDAEGNISYESKESLVELAQAAKAIADDTSTKVSAKVTASCPGPNGATWFVGGPGTTFTCTITEGTDSATVLVTVKDNEGSISWKVQN